MLLVDPNGHGRNPPRLNWLAEKLHVCLLGGTVPLPGVAVVAGSDDVLPDRLPTLALRSDVVVGQVRQLAPRPAVLALVVIPGEDVHTGELDRLLVALECVQETDDCRALEYQAGRVDVAVVLFDHFDFAEGEKSDGTLPADDLQGFIGLSEN